MSTLPQVKRLMLILVIAFTCENTLYIRRMGRRVVFYGKKNPEIIPDYVKLLFFGWLMLIAAAFKQLTVGIIFIPCARLFPLGIFHFIPKDSIVIPDHPFAVFFVV